MLRIRGDTIVKMTQQANDVTRPCGAEYLFVQDLKVMFRVGDSKARLMMGVLPSVRIGQSDCILRADLEAYLCIC